MKRYLLASEVLEQVARAVELVAVPVITVGLDGVIASANAPTGQLFDADVAEIVGQRMDDLVADDELGAANAVRDRLMREGGSITATRHIVRPDGVHFVVEGTAAVVSDDAGAPAGVVITMVDVSEIDAAAAHTRRVEARQQALLDQLPHPVLVADADGDTLLYANTAAHKMFGTADFGELFDRFARRKHLRPDDRQLPDVPLAAIAAGERIDRPRRYVILRPDGSERSVEWYTIPMQYLGGEARMYAPLDFTELASAQRELEASESRFRELAEQSPDVVMRITLEPPTFEYVSPAISELLCVTPDELYSDPGSIFQHIHRDDRRRVHAAFTGEHPETHVIFRVIDRDATHRTIEARSTVTYDELGMPVAIGMTARDVTAAVQLQRDLERIAHHDQLTGLWNRRALLNALDERIFAGVPTAVLFCDLDGFKQINDTHGHDAGDDVLIAVASRLDAAVRDDEVVARIAGDEFVVVAGPSVAESIATRLLAVVAQPIRVGEGTLVRVGASIGIAELDSADDAAQLLGRADGAMYAAKRAGKGRASRAVR